MFFISISLVNDLLKSNWRKSLSSLASLWAILLQDIGTKWWLLLVPSTVFDFAKRIPCQHKHWPFLPELDRKMWRMEFLLHIDQALIGSSKFGHVGVFVIYFLQVSNVTNGNFGFHLAQWISNFQWNPQEQSLHSLSGILSWLSEN